MGRVSTGLRATFAGFNLLFAILGGITITVGQILITTQLQSDEVLNLWLICTVLGSVIMVIAILGAYGALRESRPAMITFLVFMIIGFLIMMSFSVAGAVLQHQMEWAVEKNLRAQMPLNKAPQKIQDMMQVVQQKFNCCGLFSYKDWEDQIPDSCTCNSKEQEPGTCRQVRSPSVESDLTNVLSLPVKSVFTKVLSPSVKSVFTKTCDGEVIYFFKLMEKIIICIGFSLAGLALLGMVLSSIIIHQMNRCNPPPALMPMPTIFTTSTVKYEKLWSPPSY